MATTAVGKYEQNRRNFIRAVLKEFGEDTKAITRADIIHVCEKYSICYPQWLTNDQRYRLGRGQYKVPASMRNRLKVKAADMGVTFAPVARKLPVRVAPPAEAEKVSERSLIDTLSELGSPNEKFAATIAQWASIVRETFSADEAVLSELSEKRLASLCKLYSLFDGDDKRAVEIWLTPISQEIREPIRAIYEKVAEKGGNATPPFQNPGPVRERSTDLIAA